MDGWMDAAGACVRRNRMASTTLTSLLKTKLIMIFNKPISLMRGMENNKRIMLEPFGSKYQPKQECTACNQASSTSVMPENYIQLQ